MLTLRKISLDQIKKLGWQPQIPWSVGKQHNCHKLLGIGMCHGSNAVHCEFSASSWKHTCCHVVAPCHDPFILLPSHSTCAALQRLLNPRDHLRWDSADRLLFVTICAGTHSGLILVDLHPVKLKIGTVTKSATCKTHFTGIILSKGKAGNKMERLSSVFFRGFCTEDFNTLIWQKVWDQPVFKRNNHKKVKIGLDCKGPGLALSSELHSM